MKKITTCLFSTILAISLVAGYFCSMPNMAQAALISMAMPDMSFTDCQGMPAISQYSLSSSAPAHAIAPCCLEKKENSQSSAINLNNFSLDNVNQQLIPAAQIANDDSDNYIIPLDYPISPSQTELLSSVIIRD